MIALSFFDYSGVMMLPWAKAGYECHCFDIQGNHNPAHPNISHHQEDIADNGLYWASSFSRNRDEIVFASFFPPCDHLAVSGARWFKGKGLRALARAIELFAYSAEIAEKLGAPYLIENPVSTISTYWRKPDYTFDPCDYGDPYTKKTCLWTGNGFVMPPKNPVEPTDGSKMHKLPPGPERKQIRSQTPEGFARAVFEANAPTKAAA